MSINIADISNLSATEQELLQKLLTPRLTKYIPYTPTAKQTAFLLMNDVRELLYGGSAGGGKSIAQLMGALQYVDIPGYSAILFRKTYADLSLPGALLDVAKQWLMPFVQSNEVRWSEKEKIFTFPSSATLSFGYLESANDCYRYQGAEFQYIGMDECTHIMPSNYRYLFSRLRKKVEIPVPLRFRATCNPGGEFGDFYYNRFFIDGPEAGRIFVPAGLDDNPHLDAEQYRQSLMELDPVERERLMNGNWKIRASGDIFSSKWFPIISAGSVPANAREVRFWDLASTDPKKRKATKGRGSDKRAPDWSVGFKLAYKQGMYFIKDIIRVQYTPHDVEQLIRQTARSDGYSCAIRMEQEPGSSGAISIDNYARRVLQGYDFIGVTSTGSKVERSRTASSAAQAGNVFIVEGCRNVTAFTDELDTFPFGSNDDIIDGFSGAFSYFKATGTPSIPKGIRKAAGSYWHKDFSR